MKQRVSKLIPKGKGQNIAEFYKNGGKTKGLFARDAQEAIKSGIKTTTMQCTCCTRQILAVVVVTGGVADTIPLHMPCNTCEKWLGHLEVDNLKILDGMCLECFREETDQ